MKKTWIVTTISFISLLLSNIGYAINPVQGWYAGAYLDVSYATNTNVTFFTPFNVIPAESGSISRSVLGGVGGEVGYRYENIRVEGQLFYNNNPYSSITVGNVTVNGTSTSVNSNRFENPVTTSLTVNGQTNTGAFLINAIYDVYTPSRDNVSPFVPYIGGGVGYAYVQNNIQFDYNNQPLPLGGYESNFNTIAAQGIVGFSYFLDDFTTMGIDGRYFTTMLNNTTTRVNYNTFSTRETIYSINLVFNGAFDFG